MLDLKAIRENPGPFRAGLARRGAGQDLERLLELDEEERRLKVRVEELRAAQNRASKEIGEAAPGERHGLIESVRGLSQELKELEPRLESASEEVQALLARLPNVPHDSVPDGEDDDDNRVERKVGAPP